MSFRATKRSRLFGLLLFVLVLAACANGGLSETLAEDNDFAQSSQAYEEVDELPDCSAEVFSVSPIALEQLASITPLGNLNPPQHTLPTQHMYFHPVRENDTPVEAELRAPGNVVVTSINTTIYYQDGVEVRRDYGLMLRPCEGLLAYFLHIKELTPELRAALSDEGCWQTEPLEDGQAYAYCRDEIEVSLEAGEMIGKVGGPPFGTFDLGLYDFDRSLDYANPERYLPEALSIVCPLDYFEAGSREALYNKLEGNLASACGGVMHDVPGSLAGNWFTGDANAFDPEGWHQQLSFAPDNHDAELSVISIGGVFTKAGRWAFKAEQDGVVNLAFELVRPGETLYCYESEDQAGRILVQLPTEDRLQIERQSGDCGQPLGFDAPFEYAR